MVTRQSQPLPLWLLLGVVLFPFVFAWLTLRACYRRRTTVLAFIWLGLAAMAVAGVAYQAYCAYRSGFTAEGEPILPTDIETVLSYYYAGVGDDGGSDKYLHKFITVTGYVQEVKLHEGNHSSYIVVTQHKRPEQPYIEAFFTPAHNEQLAQFKQWDTVTAVCKVYAYLSAAVLVEDCRLR